jgi:hypothetical protein
MDNLGTQSERTLITTTAATATARDGKVIGAKATTPLEYNRSITKAKTTPK